MPPFTGEGSLDGRVGRWISTRAVAVGPSARQTPLVVRLPDPDLDNGSFTVVSVAITVVSLSVALFIPPVLLLTIPVLIGRAAVSLCKRRQYERVAIPAFGCPECGSDNPPAERRGELPLDVLCTRCAARLSIGQVRR